MANFESKVMVVENVIDHPNADRLSIIKLKGFSYQIVSGKLEDGSHRYNPGDWVVYVQADSIVPDYILKDGFWDEKNNKGMLGGPDGNRVRPIRLRNVLSEGILLPVIKKMGGNILYNSVGDSSHCLQVGDDVSEFLGITKYEPVIPAYMDGEILYIGSYVSIPKYDIENVKKYPNVLTNDIGPFYITEKLHGTFCGIGFIPNLEHPDLISDGKGNSIVVFSKGFGASGLVFKDNENNAKNLYVKTLKETGIIDSIKQIGVSISPYFLFGEIFGVGVQDLHYSQKTPTFRAFDFMDITGYMDADLKYEFFKQLDIQHVPILDIVDTQEEVSKYVDGETVVGNGENIREGVVVTPIREQRNDELGRVILKFVSEDYLNRKGKNLTEFQ
jgi:RNA ligase (TIGR02306 family)